MDSNKLLKKIERLSVDKLFGILTRNALEEELFGIKKPFNCLFIDFCNIKNLNGLLGYERVNKIIKDFFVDFTKDKQSIVGRWFSGDEIVILCENPKNILYCLIDCARKHNLSFKHKILKNIDSVSELEKRIEILR